MALNLMYCLHSESFGSWFTVRILCISVWERWPTYDYICFLVLVYYAPLCILVFHSLICFPMVIDKFIAMLYFPQYDVGLVWHFELKCVSLCCSHHPLFTLWKSPLYFWRLLPFLYACSVGVVNVSSWFGVSNQFDIFFCIKEVLFSHRTHCTKIIKCECQ